MPSLKSRKVASRETALSDERPNSDPVDESIAPLAPKGGVLQKLLARVVQAKLVMEDLEPVIARANKEWDEAMAKLEEALVAAEMRACSADIGSHRITVTMVSQTKFTVADREKLLPYLRKNHPEFLTYNSQTLKAWFTREAPAKLQEHPEKLGIELTEFSRPQARITRR